MNCTFYKNLKDSCSNSLDIFMIRRITSLKKQQYKFKHPWHEHTSPSLETTSSKGGDIKVFYLSASLVFILKPYSTGTLGPRCLQVVVLWSFVFMHRISDQCSSLWTMICAEQEPVTLKNHPIMLKQGGGQRDGIYFCPLALVYPNIKCQHMGRE